MTFKPLASAVVLATAVATLVAVQPADAARHHHMKMMKKMAGPPAHLKAGYVGAPGYVGGAPGRPVPALFDDPAPIGIFKGFPIIGGLPL